MNEIIDSMGKDCVRLVTSDLKKSSFLGGKPLVCSRFEWPRKNNKPLGFIGQLDLSEINQDKSIEWLPETGRLLFFYDLEEWPWGFDPKDKGGWAVIYDSGKGELKVQDVPQDIDLEHVAKAIKYVEGKRFISYPDGQRIDFESLGMSEDDDDEYYDFLYEHYGSEPKHQLNGFPSPVQNDTMEEQCQLVSGGIYCGNSEGSKTKEAELLREKENDWRLLFQFDSDDDVEVMWGDLGMLYFWVRESEARKNNFSDTWMILQCG